MKKSHLYLLILAFFWISCEQEADIPLPQVDSKISVSCFFSDETDTLRAMLRWSDPVFSNNPLEGDVVRDAQVVIYNNDFSVNLILDESTGFYQAPVEGFSLSPGNDYYLTVTSADGIVVSAKTRIPRELPDIRAASLSREVDVDEYGQYLVQFRFETLLGNIDPLEPYYRLMYFQKWDDPFIMSQWYQTGEQFYEFEGSTQEQNLKMEVMNYGMDTTMTLHKSYVIHGSEDYHRFHSTVQSINYGPFAEPTIIYSNVNNGLGIFAGYRQLEILY